MIVEGYWRRWETILNKGLKISRFRKLRISSILEIQIEKFQRSTKNRQDTAEGLVLEMSDVGKEFYTSEFR